MFAARSAVLEARSQHRGHTCSPPPPFDAWLVCFPRLRVLGASPCAARPTRVRLPKLSATESRVPWVNSGTKIVSSPIEDDAPFTDACFLLSVLLYP